MNKKRRSEISVIKSRIESAKDALSSVLDDEYEAMSEYPENLQATDIYEVMEDSVDIMESSIDSLDGVIDSLSEII